MTRPPRLGCAAASTAGGVSWASIATATGQTVSGNNLVNFLTYTHGQTNDTVTFTVFPAGDQTSLLVNQSGLYSILAQVVARPPTYWRMFGRVWLTQPNGITGPPYAGNGIPLYNPNEFPRPTSRSEVLGAWGETTFYGAEVPTAIVDYQLQAMGGSFLVRFDLRNFESSDQVTSAQYLTVVRLGDLGSIVTY